MPDPALRREPLDGIPAITARGRLAIEALPPATRLVLRGAAAAGAAFGLALPTAINTATTDTVRAALMLGPDEWLLIAPDGAAAEIAAAFAGIAEPHSLVDVSHRNTAIGVSGALAADVLNSGVMLDLAPAAFPVGMATRTLFAKAEIVLWRTGPDVFRIEVWRSFAGYLHGLLADAAREYVKG